MLMNLELFRQMGDLEREMDALFRGTALATKNDAASGRRPAMDIRESEEGTVVETALPGVDLKTVKMVVADGTLTLSGDYSGGVEEDKVVRWVRRERNYGTFRRTLKLAKSVDTERISAEYKDGILMIVLPKVEAARPREIQVKVA